MLSGSTANADNAIVPNLPARAGPTGAQTAALHLQVFLNGRDIKTLVEVFRDANGIFSARRSELRGAGLLPTEGPADEWVRFDALAGLSYRYDEPTQSIYFRAPEALLAPHVYSLGKPDPPTGNATSDLGVVVNYDAFGSTAAWSQGRRIAFGGGSVTLDARAFSPVGVLSSSGVLGTTVTSPATALRLDTSFASVDENRLMTYRIGDVTSSSLAWTRPIRMGGMQISRDYSSRPDLVTAPMASLSGSAAVPSSADVYINNFKMFTQEIDPGPYRIDNLPMIGGNGNATLVVHDVNGEETTVSVPFFSSARLLAAGFYDYSVETGYARTYYGEQSFSYAPEPIASASLRGGLFDSATVEAHTEDGDGLINGGAGLVVNAFQRGVVEASIAGSRYEIGSGGQISVGGATAIAGATVDVSSQRTFGSYVDLAEVTTPRAGENVASSLLQQASGGGVFYSPLLLKTSFAPPRALDRITFGIPDVFASTSLNLTFVDETQSHGQRARIASVGLSRNLAHGPAMFATAYVNLANRRDSGFFVGFSWTFDNGIAASSQVSRQNGAASVTSQLAKSAGEDVGSYGWRVSNTASRDRYGEADASYLTPAGRASVSARQYALGKSASVLGAADFSGSVGALDESVVLAPTIPDSFALVQAGAPGVSVREDNRVVGATDSSGRLLLPRLRGFETNRIAIDPTTLPLDAQANFTEAVVRPLGRSGVKADFRVDLDARDAEIVLTDTAGSPLPPGGRVEYSKGSVAVVGYDGRAYLLGLDPRNRLVVRGEGGSCAAEFDYRSTKGKVRPTIGPIKCLPTTSR